MKPDFEKIATDALAEMRADPELGQPYVMHLLRFTWNVALEEAAGVADRERTTVIGNDEYELGRNEAAIDIAANIRALQARSHVGAG